MIKNITQDQIADELKEARKAIKKLNPENKIVREFHPWSIWIDTEKIFLKVPYRSHDFLQKVYSVCL